MRRATVGLLLLFLFVAPGLWAQDICPGSGCVALGARGIKAPSGGGSGPPPVTTVYDGAEGWYDFNTASNIGNDRSGNAHHLDNVNIAQTGGGAQGATILTDGVSQRAGVADNAELSLGGDISFAACAWWTVYSTDPGGKIFVGQRTSGAQSNSAWFLRLQSNSDDVRFSFFNGAVEVPATKNNPTGSANNFLSFACGWRDASDDSANVRVLPEAAVSGSTGSSTNDVTADITIGDSAANQEPFNGGLGPVMFFKDGFPTTAVVDSIYNNGVPKLCEDLTATEKTDMVSCWNMKEPGGPYADSISTNNMTAFNTPGNRNGHAEQTVASGSGANLAYQANNTTGHLEDSVTGAYPFKAASDMTVSFWVSYETFVSPSTYVMRQGDSNTTVNWEVLRANSDRVQCQFFNSAGNTAPLSIGHVGQDSGWHFITCVYTASDRIARIYVDGVLRNTGLALPAGTDRTPETFRIDDRGTVNDVGFGRGALDDVVVFLGEAKDTTWMNDVLTSCGGGPCFYQ